MELQEIKKAISVNTISSTEAKYADPEHPPEANCGCGKPIRAKWFDYSVQWLLPEKCHTCENRNNWQQQAKSLGDEFYNNSGLRKRHESMGISDLDLKSEQMGTAVKWVQELIDGELAVFRERLDRFFSDERVEVSTNDGYDFFNKETGETYYGVLPKSKLVLPNIYIHGPVGTGKTHLVVGMAKRIMRELLLPIRFTTGINLLYDIRSTFKPDDNRDAEDLILRYSGASKLIIDDMGAEKASEWVRETFYMIIDNRYQDQLPTIITSNMNPGDLARKLDDRLVSRILEGAKVIHLEGRDHRIGKESD